MNTNIDNPETQNPTSPEEQVPLEAKAAEPIVEEAGDAEGTIEEWKAALELAVRQRDEYLDSLRRTQADFQNFKRRNQTARADGYEDGTREVVAAMLPVIDNLERAIQAGEEAGACGGPIVEGVQMTLKALIEAGKRFGLEELPAEGCDFNPEIHHAVMREQTDDPGKVLECFQKGYRVKDRIIRYSMVKVSVE